MKNGRARPWARPAAWIPHRPHQPQQEPQQPSPQQPSPQQHAPPQSPEQQHEAHEHESQQQLVLDAGPAPRDRNAAIAADTKVNRFMDELPDSRLSFAVAHADGAKEHMDQNGNATQDGLGGPSARFRSPMCRAAHAAGA